MPYVEKHISVIVVLIECRSEMGWFDTQQLECPTLTLQTDSEGLCVLFLMIQFAWCIPK
jgi:hypothetical protein